MTFVREPNTCPVCEIPLRHRIEHAPNHTGEYGLVCCPVCGDYIIHDRAYTFLDTLRLPDNNKVAIYSHAIRKQGLGQKSYDPPVITRELFDYWWSNATLPNPFEQADNLILYIGDLQNDPGKPIEISSSVTSAIIGVASHDGLQFVVESLKSEGFVEGTCSSGFAIALGESPFSIDITTDDFGCSIQLTFKGWGRYEKLKKGAASGSTAFMAMQFGHDDLDHVVDSCFRPAVNETGYELRKINDPQHQRAGLIDDRLRVEIKAARFMICDLTHNNNGAYWEAGYAEGLGKPVIYTCERHVFSERAKEGAGTHFDTNHHLHILWDQSDLDKTAEELVACIRTTIPEAQQK